ncbi:MAG: hypothetical protein D6772_12345 [Bacteroidetes bacterium]|nr:MAG: hypothetical protein D6772_12345 [Bacteroidota bacterium]
MHRILKWLFSFLLAVGLFVWYTCYTTGYFRQIEPYFRGEIYDQIPLAGVEDMHLIYSDSLLILSADDRAARRDKQPQQGHLYLLDLRQEPWTLQPLTSNLDFTFYPHGISVIANGPHHHTVYAINHAADTHTIEHFELLGDSLVYRQTLRHPSMRSPNDIVALGNGQFYFTNDHRYTGKWGKLLEDYLGLALSNVIYFDGTSYREVASGIAFANGIHYDPDRELCFVASPRHFLLKVYRRTATGELDFIEDIDCGTGVDNISLAPDGKLWIGCHPNLLAFAAYAKGDKPYSPSEVIRLDYRAPGDYEQELIYLEDGQLMAAATVAVPWQEYIFVGNVMDEAFLVLQQSTDN